MEKEKKAKKTMPWILFIILIISVIFIVVRLFTKDYQGDYILILIQALTGILGMLAPGFISRKFELEIPSVMYFFFIIFLFCSIVLGEFRDFYYFVPFWDKLLHVTSGAMLGALGFSLVNLLNQKNSLINLSPIFVAFFSFCFAVTLGVFWEFFEFTFDGLLGLNMQKFRTYDGVILVGREALMDTMRDLQVDAIGAFVMSLIGYISLKYDKYWLNKILIKRKKKAKND